MILKDLKQYIEETQFYHHTFVFFMCNDLSFINTKILKNSKKMFQLKGWMRKKFIPGNFSWRVSSETWDANCFKKGLLEKQRVPNTCNILPLKKIFFSELNRCIFQISLKYIKLVISKILFILGLCSFNFYFKITWTPNNITHLNQHKNISQRLFWNF